MRLETERLIISDFTHAMVHDLHINSLDDENQRFVPDEVFETEDAAREVLDELMSLYGNYEGPQVHPILTKGGNANVGYVQLVPLDDATWEVGYHIAKQFRGNGYAEEAVKTFLPVMAENIGLSQVYGICLKENAASVHILKKCGFEVVFAGVGEYQGEQREIVKAVWKNPAL